MARLLHWFIAVPLIVLAVLFAVSNRGMVELTLWPLPYVLGVPAFLLTMLAFLVGFLAGGIVVWAAAADTRRRARQAERAVVMQQRELAELRAKAEPSERAEKTALVPAAVTVPSATEPR
ncbi:MAG: lipopolysaccharide assembly protein LapA domain-containing protein [Alphaproteobacteria bacterium]